jgi:hypothetical protein
MKPLPYQIDGPRTTNHLEDWHNKLKKHLQHPHPNIFNLIKLLKHEEAINDMKMIQYAVGRKRVPKKRKYRQIDHRLTEQRLHNKEISPVQFADTASYLLHLD